MMAEDNNKFKAGEKAGEFKGRTEALMEEMGKDIGEIKNSLKTLNDRIISMKIKMAGISAVSAVVMTLLVLLLKEIVAK